MYHAFEKRSLVEILMGASPTGPLIVLFAFASLGWAVFLALHRRPLPVLLAHGFLSFLPVILGVYGTASLVAKVIGVVSMSGIDNSFIYLLPDALVPLSLGALASCLDIFVSVLLLLCRAHPSGWSIDKPAPSL